MNEKNKILSDEIKAFRQKIEAKDNIILFEPNNFDLFIDDIFNIIISKLKLKNNLDKIFMKNFLIKLSLFIKNSLTYFFSSFKNIFKLLNNLEKKIAQQQELLLKTIEFNKELSFKLNKFDEKINSTILKISNNKKIEVISETENQNINYDLKNITSDTKLNIIQEENLRISNELFESKKKVDILKQEIEKYNKQRTDLINKINSVNEIVNDSNILTSVFENNLDNKKITILDPNKPIVNKKVLEEEIKIIFSKKN